MTWFKFFFSLSGMYTFYYAGLLCWDFLHTQHSSATHALELTFSEHIQPLNAAVDIPPATIADLPLIASGGVSLKQMFNLAREEMIEYTRAVSF